MSASGTGEVRRKAGEIDSQNAPAAREQKAATRKPMNTPEQVSIYIHVGEINRVCLDIMNTEVSATWAATEIEKKTREIMVVVDQSCQRERAERDARRKELMPIHPYSLNA